MDRNPKKIDTLATINQKDKKWQLKKSTTRISGYEDRITLHALVQTSFPTLISSSGKYSFNYPIMRY
jgi:hypothetical protein